MNHSEHLNLLGEALTKAQAVIEGAIKDSANPFFKNSYADLSSVWDACRKPLTDNGLSVSQMPIDTGASGIGIETVLLHSSGQWLSNAFTMPVSKADAQGVGSAITYARRYALAAMVGVAPEDDDGNAATKAAPKKVEKAKGTITPTTGAMASLKPSEQAVAQVAASNIEMFWKDGLKDKAHDTFYESDLDTDTKVAIWDLLKPHSAMRNELKKINEQRKGL